MPIVVENTTSLAPEITSGTHCVGVDGLGTLFVVYRDGLNVRVQTYDRNHNIINPWFTSFSLGATATSDNIILCPFVSGGCAVVYLSIEITGPYIKLVHIDKNGVFVNGPLSFGATDLATGFPQIALASNAKDEVAIAYVTTSDTITTYVMVGITVGPPLVYAPFQLNTAFVAPQLVAGERSLFGVTSNWTGGRFASLYLRRSDGNGLIARFDKTGPIGTELNVLETLRECPTGGSNRGLSFIKMAESSEQLLVVNPIIPVDPDPPTRIRTRVYRSDLSGTVYSSIQNNPLSTNFKLNCIGGTLFASGRAAFAIDDDGNNINAFYINSSGTALDIKPNIDGTTSYFTTDAIRPSTFALGNRAAIGFHDPSAGVSPGTGFVITLNLDEESLIRGFDTDPIDVVRTSGIDDSAVTDLTGVNTTVVNPDPRPTTSLDAFIGVTKDIALVGGPIHNSATETLFSASGQLGTDFSNALAKYGISNLEFKNLTADGTLFDDRDGTTNNAPQILITIPSGPFVMARHKIASTVYDYAILLKISATRSCYIFGGIRDISTKAASSQILNTNPGIDNPLENFGAVLAIVIYPDTTTTPEEFETELGLNNASIIFRPIAGIRENSPLE